MHQVAQSTKFMQALIAFLIVGGALFWLATEAVKPAGRESLKVEAGDIRSYVSEAIKLTEQAAGGRLTANYFQTETAMLRDKLAQMAKDLGAAKPAPGFEEKFAQAQELAKSSARELNRLCGAFGDSAIRQEEKTKLEELFRQAVTLEEELK